jgi:hypothetical protein
MDQLPMELATDIVGRIAELSHALKDYIASLQATCSFMRMVCGGTEVGWRIALCQVLQHQGFWERHYYNDNYHALLTTRPASVGILEAYFLAGLRPIFVEARKSMTLPMEWL